MKTRNTELGFLYLFFDLVVLNAAIIFSAFFGFSILINDYHDISMYLLQGNLSCILTYLIFTKSALYQSDGFLTRLLRFSKQILIFLFVLFVISFLIIPHDYSRLFLLEYTALFFAGKLLFYWLLYNYLKIKRKKGLNTARVLIIGLNDTARHLQKIIENNRIMGYRFVGFVDKNVVGSPGLIGHPDNLEALIDEHHIGMVFAMSPIFSHENRLKEYLKICNRKGVRMRIVSENQNLLKSRFSKESFEELVLINPQEIPLDNLVSRIYKRLFDIAVSTFSIIFLFSWLFPILIILIKLSSKGPVFFKQKRTGINNKIFTCIKFRTMWVNMNADFIQATEKDSRITSLGHFMRKTHLDELPQFFNVFLGQMSVVGPRPHMLKHTELYSGLIKHYLVRHYMKPGITGWAQVNGYCGETDELWKMEKRVEYDMFYIENWTFFWDIQIIWSSVFGGTPKKYIEKLLRHAAM